jgi:hypothetical protein
MFNLTTIEMLRETHKYATLANIMVRGNTASRALDMSYNTIYNINDLSGNSINLQTNSLRLKGSSGTTGQVIAVGATGSPEWKTMTLGVVMLEGNTASTVLNMNNNTIYNINDLSGNSINLQTNSLRLKGFSGTTGQVIAVGATGSPEWKTITLGSVMLDGNIASTALDMSYNTIYNINDLSGNSINLQTNSLRLKGSNGITGQVIAVGTTGSPEWKTITLGSVMLDGNIASTALDMSYNTIYNINDFSGNSINLQTNSLRVKGSSGSSGQFLSVGSSGPEWKTITLGSVMLEGNTASTTLNMNNNSITNVTTLSGNIELLVNYLKINGSSGATDQVFAIPSNGGAPTWRTISTIAGSTAIPTLAEVLNKENIARTSLNMNNFNIVGVSGFIGDTINLQTNYLLLKGNTGITGQVLSVGTTGSPEWRTVVIETPTLSQVMLQGNTAGSTLNMNNFQIVGVSGISGNTINLNTNSLLLRGFTGTTGQVLSVGITGYPVWTTLITPTLSQIMLQGNTAGSTLNMNNFNIVGVSGISGNTINLQTNSLLMNGVTGTTGQVLSVGITGSPVWTTLITPTLSQVMLQGNTAGSTLNMNNFQIVGVSGISGNTINLNTNSLLLRGFTGTTGQVLSVGITGSPVWTTLITPTLSQVMFQGNTAGSTLNMNNFQIVGVSGISGNTINLQTTSLLMNGVTGTTGQVLSVGTTGYPVWRDTNELVVKGTNIGAGTNVFDDTNIYTNQYIVGGYTAGPLTIYNSDGNTSTTLPLVTNSPASNIYIVKYNNGIAQWATFVNTKYSAGTIIPCISVDSSNNTYVTSRFGSTMYAYNAPGNTYTVSLNWTSGTESYIVKYNDNGIAQWATKLNPSISDINSVIVDKNDNIVVTGTYTATSLIIYDAPGNTSHISMTARGVYDMFIIKYNSDGYALWAKHIGYPGLFVSNINYAAIDNLNNIIVTGIYDRAGLTIFNDNTNTASTKTLINPNTTTTRPSIFIVKYNDTAAMWATQIGSSGVFNYPTIQTDTANNIIISFGVQASNNKLTIQNSDGNTSSVNLPNTTIGYMCIAKYSDTGYAKWITKIENFQGTDNRFNITTDNEDIYATVSGISNLLIYDVSGNSCVPTTLSTVNATDTALVKYNSSGIAQWRMNFTSCFSFNVTTNNSYIYVTGQSVNSPLTIYNSDQKIGIILYNKVSNNYFSFMVTCSKDGFVQYANIIDDNSSSTFDSTIHKITTNNNNNTNNISFGNYSLSNLSTGDNNIALGYNAGNNLIIGSNNIYIGNTGNQYESNTIRIGNDTDHNDAIIASTNINLQTTSLLMNGVTGTTGQVVSVSSSGSPEWRDTYELVVKGTNIGAGTNVLDNINYLYTSQYIVGGYTAGTLTIYNSDGNTSTTLPLVTNSSTTNNYIVKYTNGIAQWATFVNIKNPGSGTIPCIAIDSLNNTYVTSTSGSTMYAYNAPGNTYTVSLNWTSGTESYIVKYNDIGIAQWATKLNPTISDINSVIVDKNDNIVVTGTYTATSLIIYDAPGNTSHLSMTKRGTYDMFIIKYNSDGYALWAKHIGYPSLGVVNINYAAIDNSNNIIVTGIYSTAGLTMFNDNTNTITASTKTLINPNTTTNKPSIFIVKYNDTAAMWATQIGGTGTFNYPTIQTDTANNIIVSVGVELNNNNKLTIQNSDGNTSSVNLPSTTVRYMCIAKYSDTGYVQWVTKIENYQGLYNRFNITTDNEDIYASVASSSTLLIFDVSGNSCVPTTLSTINATLTVLVKYNSSGIAQWRMNFNADCVDFNVTTNESYIYVTGKSGITPLTIYNSNGTTGIILYNKVSNNYLSFMVTCSKDGFVQYANIIDDNSNSTAATIHKITTNNNNTNNTSFGNYSLSNLSTGDNNIALGYNAGNNLIIGSNNIYIGNTGNQYESNTIRIGNDTDHNDAIIASTNINLQTTSLLMNGVTGTTGQVVSVSSSGSPEWRDTYELVVKGTNIGAGTNVLDNINYLYTSQYIVGGYTAGPLTIYNSDGNTSTTLPLVTNSPASNNYIVKYTNGIAQWASFVNTKDSGGIIIPCISVDSSNNTYVTSTFTSNVNAYNAPGNTYTVSLNWTTGTESYIVKYNDNGIAQWATKLNPSIVYINSVIVDNNDNIVVTGTYNANSLIIYDAPGNTSHLSSMSKNGSYDIFIIKYNSDGYALWAKHIGYPSLSVSQINYAAIDNLNNIIVTGIYDTAGLTMFNDNTNTASTKSLINPNTTTNRLSLFIVKYNDTAAMWATQIGSTGTFIYPTIQTDTANNIIVSVGLEASNNKLTIQNSDGNTSSVNLPITTVGCMCIAKYSDTGYAQWITKIENYNGLNNRFNITTDNEDIYASVAGVSTLLIFDVSGNSCVPTTLSTINATTTILVKYNSSGIAQWRMNFNQSCYNFNVTTNDSYIYVTGRSENTPLTIYNSNGTTGIILYNKVSTDRFSFMATCSKDGFVQYANIIDDNSSSISISTAATIYKITTNNDNTNNTSFGNYSLSNLSTGDNNIALGYNAGNNLISGSNNIYIGNTGNQYESNTIRIGNDTDHNDAIIASTNINLQTTSLLMNGVTGTTGQVVSVSSSGSPEWRDTYELVVKGTHIGAGTNVLDNINYLYTSQYIVGGYTAGPLTIYNSDGNTSTTLPLITNSPASNNYIVKYTNGIPQWATFVNPKDNAGTIIPCISVDSTNNTYVTSTFGSTMYAYDAPGNTYTVSLNWTTGTESYIVKYNDNGIAQWATKLNPSIVYINSVIVDNNDNIVVTGTYNANSLIIYDAPGNTSHLSSMSKLGNTDMFIIKYNSGGYALWAKHIGYSVTNLSEINYAAIDNSNNIIVTGIYDRAGLTIFNDNTNTASTKTLINPNTTTTRPSIFIVKYNDTAAMWATQIGSTGTFIYPTIQTDTANNIIVSVGLEASNNKLTIQNSDGNTSSVNLPIPTVGCMFIAKYNTNGFAQWITKIENYNGLNNRFNITTDNEDIYASVVSNVNLLIFDVSGNSCVPTTLSTVNATNMVLVKYNSSGIAQWRMNFNADCLDFNVTTNESYIYVTGKSRSTPLTIYNSNGTIGIILYNKVSTDRFSFMVTCSKDGFVQYANIIDDNSNSTVATIYKITTNNNNTNNTAFGNGALQNLQIGDNNIALGYNSGNNLISGSNNIYIGNEGNSYESNTIRIGNEGHNTIGVTRPLTPFYTTLPTVNEIGYRVNISPALLSSTIGTSNTTLYNFTTANGNPQPFGVYIYELRFSISTISIVNISITTIGSTAMDPNFQLTKIITTAVAAYDRITTVQSFSSNTDMWVVGISNIPATISSIGMIRTRIA